jgi:hypothetical protein
MEVLCAPLHKTLGLTRVGLVRGSNGRANFDVTGGVERAKVNGSWPERRGNKFRRSVSSRPMWHYCDHPAFPEEDRWRLPNGSLLANRSGSANDTKLSLDRTAPVSLVAVCDRGEFVCRTALDSLLEDLVQVDDDSSGADPIGSDSN